MVHAKCLRGISSRGISATRTRRSEARGRGGCSYWCGLAIEGLRAIKFDMGHLKAGGRSGDDSLLCEKRSAGNMTVDGSSRVLHE
ncbi:hypothetical protein E2C01_044634 [Portunus trituberculatus]|uniref:Uncharacterized protein n=1 Tax=Portunus trituberculatus TaxID=210409 RepID=A0A5B7FSN0_PORTR|nr:hypothetical protein [Portunus trituberculatus]